MHNQAFNSLKRGIKHMVAGTLFVGLLLGGSAAVLSALATGISSLSAWDSGALNTQSGANLYRGNTGSGGAASGGGTPAPARRGSDVSQAGSGQAAAGQQPGVTWVPGYQTPAATGQVPGGNAPEIPGSVSFTDALNNQLDHMYSPIGAAIDNGGVVIGDKVESAFGAFLSGILQTLFLEQPGASAASPSSVAQGVPASGSAATSAGQAAFPAQGPSGQLR